MVCEGWIKLHRKLIESHIFQNEKLLKVFLYCMLKATHKEREQQIGHQLIILQPGQFVFGRHKAALELDMKESTVWEYMKLLEKYQSIGIKTNNKFSLVSVANWELYQGDTEENQQQSDNKPTTKQQQSDTNKNVKNDKECKEDIYSAYTKNPELLQTFYDFDKMRSTLKNGKMTDRARKMLLTELDKLANTDEKKIAILERSILNNWKGVFPLKEDIKGGTNKPAAPKQNNFNNFEPRKYNHQSLEDKLLAASKKDFST